MCGRKQGREQSEFRSPLWQSISYTQYQHELSQSLRFIQNPSHPRSSCHLCSFTQQTSDALVINHTGAVLFTNLFPLPSSPFVQPANTEQAPNCVPGTVLGAGDKMVRKADRDSHLNQPLQEQRSRNSHIHKCKLCS